MRAVIIENNLQLSKLSTLLSVLLLLLNNMTNLAINKVTNL
jgi:hypothetical protein